MSMERKVDSLLNLGVLSPNEEFEICKELQSFVTLPVPPAQNEKANWINTSTKLLVFVSKRGGTAPGLKKSTSVNADDFRTVEPLCMAFMAQSRNKASAMAMLEVFTNARRELSGESNGRFYCSCTIAMNWFRANSSLLSQPDIAVNMSEFLIDGLCDIWSEIRSAFVKFVEQLVQSCGVRLTETLLNGIFAVCTNIGSPWQSIDGCLLAICSIVEGLSFKPANPQEHEMLMAMVRQHLLSVVWPHVTHNQVCVRESAVRAVTAHLVRADSAETCRCLELLFQKLKTKEGNPEAIEGQFTACIEILKLLNTDAINAQKIDWISVILEYLNHPATTVRLAAGTLAKTLVGKHANSSSFLHSILAAIILPLENPKVSWQEVEGRFMALDAILKVLVANHWLYNFTSSVQGPSPSRFSLSETGTTRDDYSQTQGRNTLEANADIAAEIIQLSKTQRKTKKRGSFPETKKSSISFEFLDDMKPISLLDLCIQNRSETEALNRNIPPLSSLFMTTLIYGAKMLDADQWELRRVAGQVLPYAGETIRWYSMDLFWHCVELLLQPNPAGNKAPCPTGRSAAEMAATLILAAWLQQTDRICIQIEDGRLIPSSRLKDYIFATKGMYRFVEKILSFCRVDLFDRQTVTSARVLLQFLARINLSDLVMSDALRNCDIRELMHNVMRIGVTLVWYAVEPQHLTQGASLLTGLYDISERKDIPGSSRAFLLFGSTHLYAAASQSTNLTGARISVIEQILPEIVAVSRHFTQDRDSMMADDVFKVVASEIPKDNVFLLVGSLLAPLAHLLAVYSYDTDLLPYITDSISAIAVNLMSDCRTEVLFESAVFEIECFLEQFHCNIANALASGEHNRGNVKSENGFSVYAAARVAFWGCRLVLKHGDDSFFCESLQIVAKLLKIVSIIARRILSLVPNESANKAGPSGDVDFAAVPKTAWSIVGSGEILRPTAANEVIAEPTAPRFLAHPEPTMQPMMQSGRDDDSDSFDDVETSDAESDDVDYEYMVMDDDLDELLVEVVTDMRSIVPQLIREPAIFSFDDEKERDLLAYLLL